jgi:hypothetical protein
MVVEVFVVERDGEDALPDERTHAMLNPFRRPPGREAGGEPIDEAKSHDRSSRQQSARVRRDGAAIEFCREPAPFDGSAHPRARRQIAPRGSLRFRLRRRATHQA